MKPSELHTVSGGLGRIKYDGKSACGRVGTDGEPEDAVFKALAIVPMTGRRPGATYEGPPFDVQELLSLIKKEYQA